MTEANTYRDLVERLKRDYRRADGTWLDADSREAFEAISSLLLQVEKLKNSLEMSRSIAGTATDVLTVHSEQNRNLLSLVSELAEALEPYADWDEIIEDALKQGALQSAERYPINASKEQLRRARTARQKALKVLEG